MAGARRKLVAQSTDPDVDYPPQKVVSTGHLIWATTSFVRVDPNEGTSHNVKAVRVVGQRWRGRTSSHSRAPSIDRAPRPPSAARLEEIVTATPVCKFRRSTSCV